MLLLLLQMAGNDTCRQPNVVNSTLILCTAQTMVVDRYPVIVSLNAQNSTDVMWLARLCGEGQFALPGAFCGPCPKVRVGRLSSRALVLTLT